MKKIVIVGAGISGLSLAYFLEKKYGNKIALTLIEKESRVGGWLRTLDHEGTLLELGPRALRMGPETRQLAKELGLEVIDALPTAKERYIAHKGNLEKINLHYLWQYQCFWPLLGEFFQKKEKRNDESIASFFRKRVSQNFVDHLIMPLCKGIFAQNPEELSLEASFPSLWQKGSIMRTLLTKKKSAPLSTFAGGIEALPRALAHHLKSTILLGEEVKSLHPHTHGVTLKLDEKELEADLLFLATPHLFNLSCPFPQNKISLTIVNCIFAEKQLPHRGFGFLSKDPGPLLGISFDSNIFSSKTSHLCALLQGEHSEEEAQKITLHALQTYVKLPSAPKKMIVSLAKEALYQYPVGHVSQVERFEKTLPSSILLATSRFYGISVNECIAHSQKLVDGLGSIGNDEANDSESN